MPKEDDKNGKNGKNADSDPRGFNAIDFLNIMRQPTGSPNVDKTPSEKEFRPLLFLKKLFSRTSTTTDAQTPPRSKNSKNPGSKS